MSAGKHHKTTGPTDPKWRDGGYVVYLSTSGQWIRQWLFRWEVLT